MGYTQYMYMHFVYVYLRLYSVSFLGLCAIIRWLVLESPQAPHYPTTDISVSRSDTYQKQLQ